MSGLQVLRDYNRSDLVSDVLPGLLVYRFYGPLIFTNVKYFIERLQGLIDKQKQPVQQVLIDASAIPSLDYTAAEKLQPYLEKLTVQGIELAIARVHLPLREIELGNEMDHLFPEERIFSKVADAVAAFDARTRLSDMYLSILQCLRISSPHWQRLLMIRITVLDDLAIAAIIRVFNRVDNGFNKLVQFICVDYSKYTVY